MLGRKERNVLFNDALKHILIYGNISIGHVLKDHSVREETCCHHYMGYFFGIAVRDFLHAPFHRQDSTYHGLCHRVMEHWLERELAQWVHPMKNGWWVVGLILHGVDPLSYFSFQPVLHDWCNKKRGMCYPVCGMVHIKEALLLIGKSSLWGGSGFSSLTIWVVLYHMSDAI